MIFLIADLRRRFLEVSEYSCTLERIVVTRYFYPHGSSPKRPDA